MKWLKRIGACIGVLALTVGLYTAYLQLSGNVHEVVPGEFYRSAQLSRAKFESVIREYGIKTVINLRGPSKKQWYKDEVAEAARLGIRHVDFKMSASRQLTLDQTRALITLMRNAPKPLLVHCQGGADRTGLASVIYTSQIAGVQEDRAELQLSPLFGHFGIPYLTGTYAMDETWENLEVADGIEKPGYL